MLAMASIECLAQALSSKTITVTNMSNGTSTAHKEKMSPVLGKHQSALVLSATWRASSEFEMRKEEWRDWKVRGVLGLGVEMVAGSATSVPNMSLLMTAPSLKRVQF